MNIDDLSDDELEGISLEQLDAALASENSADNDQDENQDNAQSVVNDQVSNENTSDENTEDQQVDPINKESSAEGASDAVDTDDVANLSDDQLGDTPPTAKVKAEEPVKPTEEVSTEKDSAPDSVESEAPVKAEAEIVIDRKLADEAYTELFTRPIRANGKDITLRTVDEVRRLVQQGANYNKKMEELKPLRKVGSMLADAGLDNNEVAVAQMIDLYKGKPEALVKVIKDLGIDIYSLDMESSSNYSPDHHLKSDEQVIFNETLAEYRNSPEGREALARLDSWDLASKNKIWGNAAALRELVGYMNDGVYDIVSNEVTRRKVLGEIPEGTPFVDAFVYVGKQMATQQGAQVVESNVVPAPVEIVAEAAAPVARTPVATGPKPLQAPKAGDPRAAAASSPRTGTVAAKPSVDIYSLTDDDLMKMDRPPV